MAKRTISGLIIAIVLFTKAFGALVDIDGNPVTNETSLADIDMAAGSLGDLKQNVTNGLP